MDAKDLRTETTINQRNNDGRNKYTPTDNALQYDRNRPYQDIGSNSTGKVDVTRPCAVIGPDRVLPPLETSESYLRRNKLEPWPNFDTYTRPPEYPHKLTNYQNPIRNISPRQTFQENMQRVLVPTRYSTAKINEELPGDRNLNPSKNLKHGVSEVKYCEVPYTNNVLNNEQKNVNNMPVTNINSSSFPSSMWPPGNTSARAPPRSYDNSDLYQYPDYASCAGPKSMPTARPIRTVQDDINHPYPEPYYHTGNFRLKPYATVKERCPPPRYEFATYPNSYPHPPFQSHNYDVHKSIPPHLYNNYPQIPLKYIDSRVCDPALDGYQRSIQQTTYTPLRNQVIHPTYAPIPGTCIPNKLHSFTTVDNCKQIPSTKINLEHNKMIDYGNVRSRAYLSESFYSKDTPRGVPLKSQIIPNYPAVNFQTIHPNPYYRKDIRSYEYYSHFKGTPDSSANNISRLPPQFSPKTLAISPSESNTSNETIYTSLTSQEDCGYASQSSNASIRSIDARMYNDYYKRCDYRYGPEFRLSSLPKSSMNANSSNKNKKNIDVRQFLQMWNEGDDENLENNKDSIAQPVTSNNHLQRHDPGNDKEQLYVLGLVNVPSEELGKYDHIQKISKLPDNIKGYNNIELLCQFEEAIESSKINNIVKPTMLMENQSRALNLHSNIPRSISPLDVEAKISQSVIHKDVGCNFEIKPCSPKMLSVEVAAPIQSVINERMIEKVANPHILKSPLTLNQINSNVDNCIHNKQDHSSNHTGKIPSCKMTDSYASNDAINSIKTDYNFQDLEGNSGVCLASLPRLDNDIELNFPEVNQQFIKANKLMNDSVITSHSPKSINSFEGNHSTKDVIKENLDSLNSDIYQLSPNSSDKSFTKLSKYRKNKINFLESKQRDPLIGAQAIRTDSVIIKNPENCKNLEENNSPLSISKLEEEQNKPMNLTTQCYETIDSGNCNNLSDDSTQEVIDFSLNASDNSNVLNAEEESIASTSLFSAEIFERNDVKLTSVEHGSKYVEHNLEHSLIEGIGSEKLRDSEVNEESLNTYVSNDIHKERPDLEKSHLKLNTDKLENVQTDKAEMLTYVNDHVSYESRSPIHSESLISEDIANIINAVDNKVETISPSTMSNDISYDNTKIVSNITESTKLDENNIESKPLFESIGNNDLKFTDHCITNNTKNILKISAYEEQINNENILVRTINNKAIFDENIIKGTSTSLEIINCANLIEQKDVGMNIKSLEVDKVKNNESRHTKIYKNQYVSNHYDKFKESENPNAYNDLMPSALQDKEVTVNMKLNESENVNNDEPLEDVSSASLNDLSNSYKDLINSKDNIINNLIQNVTVTKNSNSDESQSSKLCSIPKVSNNEKINNTIPNDYTINNEDIQTNVPFTDFQEMKATYDNIKADLKCEKNTVLAEKAIINVDERQSNMPSEESSSKNVCEDMINSGLKNKDEIMNVILNENGASCVNFAKNYDLDIKENRALKEDVIIDNDKSEENKQFSDLSVFRNGYKDMIKNDMKEVKIINTISANNVITNNQEFQSNTSFVDVKTHNTFCDIKTDFKDKKEKPNRNNEDVIVNIDESRTSVDSNLRKSFCNDNTMENFKEKEITNTLLTENKIPIYDGSRRNSEDFNVSMKERDFMKTNNIEVSNKINKCSDIIVTDNVKDIKNIDSKKFEDSPDKHNKSEPSLPITDLSETGINSTVIIVDMDNKESDITKQLAGSINNIQESKEITSCTELEGIPNGYNYIEFGLTKEEEVSDMCMKEDDVTAVQNINNTNDENNALEKNELNMLSVDISKTVNTSDILLSIVNKKEKSYSNFLESYNNYFSNTKSTKYVEIVNFKDADETVNENENEKKKHEVKKCEHLKLSSYEFEKCANNDENNKFKKIHFESSTENSLIIDNFKENLTRSLMDGNTNCDDIVMKKQLYDNINSETLLSESVKVESMLNSVSVKHIDTISNHETENEDEMTIDQHQSMSSKSCKSQTSKQRHKVNSESLILYKKIYNRVYSNKELFSSRIQNLLTFNEGKIALHLLPFQSDYENISKLNISCQNIIENDHGEHVRMDSENANKDIVKECNGNTSSTFVTFSTVAVNDFIEQQSSLENEGLKLKTTEVTNLLCETENKIKTLKELAEEIVASNNVHIIDGTELRFLHEVDINLQTDDNISNDVQIVEHKDALELFSERLKSIERNKCLRKPKNLKRSLSDSALDNYLNDNGFCDAIIPKRRKTNIEDHSFETEFSTGNLSSILHNNRRNSVAAFNNVDNVSFCILINNDYIIEEESENITYPITSENVLNINDDIVETTTINLNDKDESYHECLEDKSLDESWVDDVACVETVVTDDIAEDIVISASTSPKEFYDSDREFENAIFNNDISDHTDKVKYFYRNHMSSNDAQLVEQLYITPQMDVTKTLSKNESQHSENYKYYDKESLVKVLSESNYQELPCECDDSQSENAPYSVNLQNVGELDDKENQDSEVSQDDLLCATKHFVNCNSSLQCENVQDVQANSYSTETKFDVETSCESSGDGVLSFNHDDSKTKYLSSSSPEVSSTTSEEKNSSILLKITKYNGSRISHISDNKNDKICCKYTETNTFLYNNSNKPLITKAAQKYIPPIKETIRDLKVKLPLPPNSLIKLKQLKSSKSTPSKPKLQSYKSNMPKGGLKKPKLNFEDVLKGIEESQIKMHKEKCRKPKKSIPKVVIKKNEYGSHYASTSNNTYNPDLTGRKWQPWVFLEKNRFIDKMALRKKTRAVYNHRKKTYVLIEKFYKYKAVSSKKFFITQPKADDSSQGQLKCTIKLKHNC